ncbi:MAG: PorP/SprF family type IX secretion system membrane protein [Thermoflavifilum sp.]|nr:PorP/SprF family type IX secretion system membrane protein [Thermoflavifilum sp.]
MKKLYAFTGSLAVVWVLWGGHIRAQDIHLSQFYEAPLLQNPALAGIFTGDYRIQAVYRNQWSSVTVPYQTGALSGEARFPVKNSSDFITVALQFTYDVAGTSHLHASQVMPCINYHKSLSESRSIYLSLGVMGGWVNRQLDPSKLTFDNQYNPDYGFDPNAPSNDQLSVYGYQYLDGAVGMSLNAALSENTYAFVGVSYYHLNKPKVSFYNNSRILLQPKWQYHAGVSSTFNERIFLIGEFNHMVQGAYEETMVGGLAGMGLLRQGLESNIAVYVGGFLRWKDALIPVVKLDMGEYDVAFSYDMNISKLATASETVGGFEISLSWKGFFTNPNSSLNKVKCPRF